MSIVSTVLLVVGGALVALWLLRFAVNYLRRKTTERSLMVAAEDTGILATTPEQVFEHNLRVLERDDPKQAAGYLHWWIMQAVIDGRDPRKADVERLCGFGNLIAIDEDGRALYPDAAYEMKGVVRGRVFFREDLTLAGYKDYQSEIEAILLRTMEKKHLFSRDAEFLRRIGCLFEAPRIEGEYYGGPGLPYPDQRYFVREKVGGETSNLYFDENLNLVVAIKHQSGQKDEVLWERPGARQPELYK